jgi:undecaprenyl-phosphate 4-deoxy-4-formamido-L-arabinose transferase
MLANTMKRIIVNNLEEIFVSVVIPVYNSESTIASLIKEVNKEILPRLGRVEFVLVNDDSQDNSHPVILDLLKKSLYNVTYIQLLRNFGEHNAVMCGLNHCRGDCAVIIDDDFQNPPQEIIKLVKRMLEDDADIVYSYYPKKKHSLFRNAGSKFNDMVAHLVLGKPRGLYLSSFKAISKKLIEIIIQYRGPFPYIDALILRSTTNISRVLVEHGERKQGRSNYTLRLLIRLWSNMFIGFSVWPLRLAAVLGIIISVISVLMIIYFVLARFFGPFFIMQDIPPGWASTISLITLFAGAQLFCMAMIGEYLGRLVLTINNEPQFLIRETYTSKFESGKDTLQ